MDNPPKDDFAARWHEFIRMQRQVGFEKLWLAGLSLATVITGLSLWLLLSTKPG